MKHLDIKRALADHNITQVQLGEKLGLSPQSLTSVIKGNPTVKKIEDIATAIGCDITDLFYPDPAEEAAEQERREKEMEQEREKSLESAKDSKMPLALILRDLTKKAYPSITKEEVEEWMEAIRKKNGIQGFDITPSQWGARNAMDKLRQFEEARKKHNGETLNATLGGDLVSENQQQMIQTSTFCPHCGKKVRVGVVLLDS